MYQFLQSTWGRLANSQAAGAPDAPHAFDAESIMVAQRDRLTGLFHRDEFDRQVQRELLRAQRYGGDISLLVLNVDHFRRVNNTYGRLAGDDVLAFVANALSCGVRKTDVVARMGGDEFMVLLPQTAQSDAHVVADKLRQWLQESPMHLAQGYSIPVTASLGLVSLASGSSASLSALYAAAELALATAKSEGRNRIEVCAVSAQESRPLVTSATTKHPHQ